MAKMQMSTIQYDISSLRKSISEEVGASRKYRARAKATKNPRAKALWLHVAEQEDHHAEEFRGMLKIATKMAKIAKAEKQGK